MESNHIQIAAGDPWGSAQLHGSGSAEVGQAAVTRNQVKVQLFNNNYSSRKKKVFEI